MSKFVIKRITEKPLTRMKYFSSHIRDNNDETKNKKEKEKPVMNTKEKIEMAKEALNQKNELPKFKKVRKDKGLIERTESSVTILTEDNKELLKD